NLLLCFFSDTDRREIYTLSLHDALPIFSGGGYGMGAAVGDYDGDGWPDLLVTQYNGVILYHNNGDGTFSDVTVKAGLPTEGWASDRKSTRLNSSHVAISYAVFCLKKNKR